MTKDNINGFYYKFINNGENDVRIFEYNQEENKKS